MNTDNNATERLRSDNTSNEKATKTIRPKLAIHAAVMVTCLSVILLIFAFAVKPTINQVTIVQSLMVLWGSIYMSIIGFYFVAKHREVAGILKSTFGVISSKIIPKSTAKGITETCLGCGSKDVLPNQFYCKDCT